MLDITDMLMVELKCELSSNIDDRVVGTSPG